MQLERLRLDGARRRNRHEQSPDLIDINCGCWVSNVALRGAGAGLLRDLPQMKSIRRVISATHLPVTVKTRLGWDGDNIQIVDVARIARPRRARTEPSLPNSLAGP